MKNIKWSNLHPNKVNYNLKLENPSKMKRAYTDEEDEEFDTVFTYWESWVKSGKQVYCISINLLELFFKTDIRGITIDMVRFPYDDFYVKFETEYKGFSGFYAGIIQDDKDGISIDFTLTFQDKLYHLPFCSISEYPNKELENCIVSKSKHFDKDMLNVCINSILYFTFKAADIKKQYPDDVPIGWIDRLKKAKNKTAKEVALRTIKNAGYSIINLVGSTFTKQKLTNDETNTVATHWRRGHWRNQPFGINEKKLIWIMPVIVNAKNGEPAKGHIYKS